MRRSYHRSGDLGLSVAGTGTGQPFVFQHGLCADAAQPTQVFPSGIGYRCATVECRGHGLSDVGPKQELSIATFADDIVGYIRASGMGRPVLGGISMGAAISLRVAVRFPEVARALVIARPAWLVDANPDNMKPNALVGELLGHLEPKEARRQFDASAVAAMLGANGPDNLVSLRGFFSRDPIDVTSTLLRQISADGPAVSEDEVRGIALPTLVIGHGRDFIHPLAYARQLADWIPGARFVEITPKADNLDCYRADFQRALSIFLEEVA